MLTAYQNPVQSNPATQFTEELITNAMSANVDLVLPGRNALWFIRSIAIIATENLQYELALFSRSVNATGVIATEAYVGSWQFGSWQTAVPASPGYISGADGLFKGYVDGNLIPYFDLDQLERSFGGGTPSASGYTPTNAKLHCRLINRSTATKPADAAGAVQVIFYVAQQGAQA